MSSTTAAESQSSQIGKSKDGPVDSPGIISGPISADSLATGDDFTTSTTPAEPPYLSETESRLYYYGLSKARLIARTGSTPWEEPTGPEASWRAKEFGVAGSHEISKVWDALAPKVLEILKKGQVDWTSVDLVRIGYDDEYPKPVVVWIGIDPDSQVPYKVNYDTAVQCKQLLIDHDINDVEVEMRGSKVRFL